MDNKKLLSALLDGELTEIEEHQLLRQADVDSSRKDWMFWQEIRLAGKAIESERRLSPEQHQLLYQRVQQAIAVEADLDAGAVQGYRSSLGHNVLQLKRKVVSHIVPLGAMAAMLALAVSLVNLNPVRNDIEQAQRVAQDGAAMSSDSSKLDSSKINRSALGSEYLVQAGNTASDGLTDSVLASNELKAIDDEGMQRLRAYLKQHDQMTQLPRKSRFAKYPGPIEK
jgi:negative regulator of sigma E activity